jgi:ABC-2 type transport system permease protein
MNPAWNAVRTGFERGRIELWQYFTTVSDMAPMVVMIIVFLAVMLWTRNTHVPGTHFSLGTTMLASVLGMNVGFNGMATMGGVLAVEREDGTLLRAKATPNGMLSYLIGKVVSISGIIALGVVSTLITGAFLFSGLAVADAGTWLTLAWVLVLGLLATLPLGAIIGSLMPSARSAGLLTLGMGAIIAVSGVFYPITHLPRFLQWIGQVFPLYWLGLGMRSALLPSGLAAVEIDHSWRHLATFGVLAGWSVAGMVVAPWVLRRMARRESGSSVAARREKALLQVGP